MVLKIAICENETRDLEVLTGYIDALALQYPYFRIKKVAYRSGIELIEHYKRSSNDYYDIIFFDVDLKETLNGIEVAHKLRELDKNVLLIYVTNFSEFINDASVTHMFRYLEKPVPQQLFNEVFEYAIKTLDVREKIFEYTYNYQCYKLLARNIKYFERIGSKEKGFKTEIHTADGKVHNCHKPLSKVIEDLGEHGFVSIYSCLVINMAYAIGVEGSNIILTDDVKLPISRNKKAQIRSLFFENEFKRCKLV